MSSKVNIQQIFKNFSTLFVGLLFVQLINFIFSLILPKYFSPADFAEFGIFTSVTFILIEIINAKLDVAVMLPKESKVAKEVLDAAFTVACIATILIGIITIPLYLFYNKIYFLLPITCFLYGIHQPVLTYLNKQSNYAAINWFRIIQVLNTIAITLLLALYKVQHALIYGFLLGLCIASIFVLTYVQPKYNYALIKKIWKRYDQFPKFGTWSALLNNISRNSIPILLAQFFSQQIVGWYSYATRLLNAPTGMYSSALGQVYYKSASELNQEDLKRTTREIVNTTFIVAVLPSLIILFFGKDIFRYLFNEEWVEAGKISQYLILWYLLGVITAPISSLLDIKNKLKFEFKFNAALFILRISAILIGGVLHNFYLAILLFSIVGITMNLFLLYYINKIILDGD